MKYFFHIAYKGTQYRGWQRQPDVMTVQEVLEDSFAKMLGQKVSCMGCGRTDAGVHANQFFFHTVIDQEWDYDPVFRLNKMLPDDIAVFEMIQVESKAHAQHDAIERTYDYFIHSRKEPFLSDRSTLYLLEDLDLMKMKVAAGYLTRYQDYRALCKTPDVYRDTRCKVSSAGLFVNGIGDRIRFQITSDRFLQGMVRLIVGNLLEIGTGKLSLDQWEDCLKNFSPLPYFKMAYPQGLYLSKVKYPYLDLPPRKEFAAAASDWLQV